MIIASHTAGAVYDINIFGLSVTFLLVALAAILTVVMRLGMAKSMIWSTLRSLLQLLAMGYIIKYVIEANNPWIVLALMVFMVIAAVQITLTRADGIPRGLVMPVLLTLMVSVLIVDSVVSELIIAPSPWYAPQILIPVTGMMLGNLVAAIAVAMSRFFSDMKAREYEVEVYLSMGATPFEAAKPSIIASAKLGLIPTIAQLASSGIVLIPGMMAGQIMAGGDPLEAAKYQFVVLAALSSITIIGDTLIMILIYRRCFTELDQFEPHTV
ncbi:MULTISPECIES: ABC transporter permease [Bifidobacterium]|uniref:UDP-Glucose Exporter (U-GlcE) family protein, ABC transporter n=2 Tax=Bifidobacterium TaxID=1678 RepID=A0A087CK07_9BIFI|nr:iron export ABC transporter permease subunit FetB [Bifidobacterium psychraerophilum]KFI83607.1 UDP-Glucose Exporter (U-GlcE) family protein, ABC transporter [Bifidobacterium psychraerophilum]PKA94269.1 putative ABC transport system permease protein [Bifidobacterium psychraerophilum DSM 22366]